MVENEYIGVNPEYLKELEKKAKNADFFEGYIKGVEVAFAFTEEIVKAIKAERGIIIPKAHGRKQAFAMIDEIYAMAGRKTESQTDPCDGCVCDDGKHLMYCMNCKGIAWKTEPPQMGRSE